MSEIKEKLYKKLSAALDEKMPIETVIAIANAIDKLESHECKCGGACGSEVKNVAEKK